MKHIFNYFDDWVKLSGKYHRFWSTLFLSLISLSFVLSDWMIGLFTFSEYIIGIALVLLIILGQFKITRKQIKIVTGIIMFLFVHLIFQETFNDLFVLKTEIAAIIKLMFYILMTICFFNYIVENNLKKKFLMINNVVAIIVSLIGLYIILAIYSDGFLPFDFLWHFTRSDVTSYIFNNGTISFVRMRSVFSEPSYLGFYLNTILAMNYFNSSHIKISNKFSIFISIIILLTLSYSAIAIMLISTFMYLFFKKKEWLNRNKRRTSISALLLLVFVIVLYFLFQDFFHHVFIQRTIDIFTDNSNSGYSRLIGSWKYVSNENFLLGNGLGHTPSIWNIYAYMISDLGTFGLLASVFFTVLIIKSNKELGIFFVLMNFSKGGYLSSSFWLFLLLVVIYSNKKHDETQMHGSSKT